MHQRQIQLLAAIGETFVPPRFAGDWHGGDHTSMAIVLDYYGRGPWFVRLALSFAALLLDLSPLFLIGTCSTFRRLDKNERSRHLNRYARILPFSLIFAPLRVFLALSIYSRPDAIAETGYHNRGKAGA